MNHSTITGDSSNLDSKTLQEIAHVCVSQHYVPGGLNTGGLWVYAHQIRHQQQEVEYTTTRRNQQQQDDEEEVIETTEWYFVTIRVHYYSSIRFLIYISGIKNRAHTL